jgi:hypothetical protein
MILASIRIIKAGVNFRAFMAYFFALISFDLCLFRTVAFLAFIPLQFSTNRSWRYAQQLRDLFLVFFSALFNVSIWYNAWFSCL